MSSKIIITSGDPAGIGPDILLQALTQNTWSNELIVAADPDLLKARSKQLGIKISLQEYNPNTAQVTTSNTITVLPINCPAPVIAGKLDPRNAHYVLKTLEVAAKGCLNGEFAAMVTPPHPQRSHQ